MDLELSKLESDLQTEESQLHADLMKLTTVGRELATRLAAVQQRAESLGQGPIAARAGRPLPSIDEASLWAARDARLAAIQARRQSNAGARLQLATLKTQLQKLSQQLISDEQALAEAEAAQHAENEPEDEPVAPPPTVAARPAKATAVARSMVDTLPSVPQVAPPRRQSPRVKMQAAVDFTSDNNFFNGFSANISDGGLFVATVNLVPVGTEVDLAFSLPSGQRIESKGIVRWVREVNDQHGEAFPGIGVQFAGLPPQAQSAINAFLAEREPLFFAE